MQGKWRFWVLAAALLVAILSPAQSARSTSSTSIETANLQDTLEKGLKARFPREFKFIAEVVKLVEQKVLPLPMVMGTFKWAREKEQKYPFVYFEQALRLRAQRIGVKLPKL